MPNSPYGLDAREGFALSSSAAKKNDDQHEQLAELVEMPAPNAASNDREQGLSLNFQDPNLEELIPGLVQPSAPGGVVEETVEAVQELLGEAKGISGESHEESALDLSASFADLNLEPAAPASFDPDPAPASLAPVENVEREPSMMISVSGQSLESGSRPQWEMSQKLFQLVVCELSFDDLVESALGAIMGAIGAQAGAVLEMDQTQQNYFFRSSIGGGDPEKVKAFRVPFHKGIVGHVGESRRAMLLRDLEEDQKQMRAISMSAGFEAKTCMAAPIVVGGQLYGVIELFNCRDGGFFSEQELQLLEEGTRMLAKVLEVRFLMAELLKRGE
jgi:GAF domain-containing protein